MGHFVTLTGGKKLLNGDETPLTPELTRKPLKNPTLDQVTAKHEITNAFNTIYDNGAAFLRGIPDTLSEISEAKDAFQAASRAEKAGLISQAVQQGEKQLGIPQTPVIQTPAGIQDFQSRTGYGQVSEQARQAATPDFIQSQMIRRENQGIDRQIAALEAAQMDNEATRADIPELEQQLAAARTQEGRLLGSLDFMPEWSEARRNTEAAMKKASEENTAAMKKLEQKRAELEKANSELEELRAKKYFNSAELDSLGLPEDLRKKISNVPQWQAEFLGKTQEERAASGELGQEPAQVSRLRRELKSLGLQKDQIDRLFDMAQRQYNTEQTKVAAGKWAEFADKNPVTGTVATLLSPVASLASGIGYIGQAISKAVNPDVPLDYDSPSMRPYQVNQAIRGTVGENIRDSWAGNVGAFLYNTGTSMLDSGVAAAITATTGFPAAVLLGGSAATASMAEAKKRGATDSQAVSLGLLSGIAEEVFENVSIERLLSMPNPENARALLKNALKQSFAEGSEEFNTTIANTLADALVMGDKSEIQTNIQAYLDQGLTQGDAEKRAALDWLSGLGLDALGGAISGGLMAGGHGALQMAANRRDFVRGSENPAQDTPVRNETEVPPAQVVRDSRTADGSVATETSQRTPARTPLDPIPHARIVQDYRTAGSRASDTSVNVTEAQDAVKPSEPILKGQNETPTETDQEAITRAFLDLLQTTDKKTSQRDILNAFLSQSGSHMEAARQLIENGTVGVNGSGNFYVTDPARHIDQRDIAAVGDRTLPSFQYEYPQLQPYFREAAALLSMDLDNTTKGERFPLAGDEYQRTWTGTKRNTSPEIAELKDQWGLSYEDISKAIDAIINDRGQENYAAAKRVEMLLDHMLSYGHKALDGTEYPPNEGYLEAKQRLPGADLERFEYQPESADLDMLDAWLDPLKTDSVQGTPVQEGQNANPSIGAADAGFDPFSAWQNQSDAFHPTGENPVRPVDLPVKNLDGQNTMRSGRTIMEAAATPDQRVEEIEKMYVDGKLAYIPQTREDLANEAAARIERDGWNTALNDWTAAVKSGKVNSRLVAMGAQLLNNMGNSDASQKQYAALVSDYSMLLHNAGQALQAARILKMLTPEGRLYAIRRSIDSINDGLKQDTGLELDPGLMDEYRKANSDEERDAILDRMKQDIADRMPSSLITKWTALRYINMLGNFKAQIRNLLGNASMGAMSSIKNQIGSAIEAAVNRVHPMERTKSALVGRAWMKAALADFSQVEDLLRYDGKYQDPISQRQILREINDKRTIFKNNGTWGANPDSGILAKGARKTTDAAWSVLEKYRKITNWAASEGDVIFLKHHYARALAGYLKSNGVQAAQLMEGNVDSGLLDRARDYAIQEAQEATFHDNNAFSSWVSSALRHDNTPRGIKALGEGLAPFRKTPANILVRGMEYSPAGLIDTVVKAGKALGGDASASDVINSAAKSLTGTGLLLLGMALRSRGLIRATSEPGDEDIDALMNRQEYSLVLGNGSYTFDWLAPSVLPVFMGATLQDALNDQELTWKDADNVIGRIADPILNMSMMSGINDALKSVRFADNGLLQLAASFALSYLTQGIANTLLGQLERSSEEKRTATYTDEESALPLWLQKTIGSLSSRSPGWDFQQMTYMDEFGRTEDNGPLWLRAFENLFSPGWYAETNAGDPVYDEAQRLHDSTGVTISPQISAPKKITYDGQDYQLSPAQRHNYQKKRGELTYDIMQQLSGTGHYQSLGAEDQAKFMRDIVSLANDAAKAEALAEHGVDYTSSSWDKAFQAVKAGAELREYLTYRSILNASLSEDESPNQAAALAALEQMPDTETEIKGALWQLQNSSWNPDKNPYTGTLAKAGIPASTTLEIMRKYGEIDDMDKKAAEKAAEFSKYLDGLRLSKAQRAVVDGQNGLYRFSTRIYAKPKTYNYDTMSDTEKSAWDNWGQNSGYSMKRFIELYALLNSYGDDGKALKKEDILQILTDELGSRVKAEEFWRGCKKKY